MIEIILLIFFSLKVGKIAESKGYNRTLYRILAIVLWIVFELLGAMLGSILFEGKTFSIYMLALFGAGLSAVLSYSYVNSMEMKETSIKD